MAQLTCEFVSSPAGALPSDSRTEDARADAYDNEKLHARHRRAGYGCWCSQRAVAQQRPVRGEPKGRSGADILAAIKERRA